MPRPADDYTNNGMKGTDILNGVEDGWLINYCGKMLLKYFVFRKKQVNNKSLNLYMTELSNKLFDVVVAVGPNDKDIVSKQVKYTQENVIGYRNIYIIPFDPTFTLDGCITIPETMFPFSKDTIKLFHPDSTKRVGWYLQQLFKLYAGCIIPDILDTYLVIDADTFFFHPTTFIDTETGAGIFNYSSECHLPYIQHLNKMHPTLFRMDTYKSGICHHMLFRTAYISELFGLVECYHHCPFYEAFFKCIWDADQSGASEYEIYFNFMLKYHPQDIQIRKLLWKNENSLDAIDKAYDYFSYHTYLREPPTGEYWQEYYYTITD